MNRLVILFFILGSIFANGQGNSWSLQKCIATALENNVEIKMKQLEVVKARKSYTNPLLDLVPSVGITGNHNYNFGSTIDPSTNARVSSDFQSDNFALNASLNLLDFGNIALSQQDKIGIDIAKADKKVVEYQYKLQVLELYFTALFAQESVKIQKEQLQNSKVNLTRIEKEVAIGSKPKSDLYDIQFGFSQDEKRLLEAEQASELQKVRLFQLMNFKIDPKEIVLETKTELILENAKVTQNPKMDLAQLKYKSAKKDVAILRATNLPSLSGFYALSSFYSTPINTPSGSVLGFERQLNDNKYHQAGLQLSVPVFTGFRKNKQIIASKIESQRTKLAIEQEQLKLDQEIELENKRKQNYSDLVKNLNQTLLYAQSSFTTTQSKFTNGTIDAVVFSAVKNQLLASEYEVLKNQILLQMVAVKILFLKGK